MELKTKQLVITKKIPLVINPPLKILTHNNHNIILLNTTVPKLYIKKMLYEPEILAKKTTNNLWFLINKRFSSRNFYHCASAVFSKKMRRSFKPPVKVWLRSSYSCRRTFINDIGVYVLSLCWNRLFHFNPSWRWPHKFKSVSFSKIVSTASKNIFLRVMSALPKNRLEEFAGELSKDFSKKSLRLALQFVRNFWTSQHMGFPNKVLLLSKTFKKVFRAELLRGFSKKELLLLKLILKKTSQFLKADYRRSRSLVHRTFQSYNYTSATRYLSPKSIKRKTKIFPTFIDTRWSSNYRSQALNRYLCFGHQCHKTKPYEK